jgi:hypothetical protein|nr:MAG TPA: hypothetical protein [Caudoviricetes sp.]
MALTMKALEEKLSAQQKQIEELVEAQAGANKVVAELTKLSKDQLKSKEKLADTVKNISDNLKDAMHYIDSLNITLVALAYTVKATPKRVEAADPEKYLKYIEDYIHPLIRRADQLTTQITENAKEAVAKVAKEVKERKDA